MNALGFAAVLDNKLLAYMTPTKERGKMSLQLIAKYNQSVHHLNQLAEEVRDAIRHHNALVLQMKHNNGEKTK